MSLPLRSIEDRFWDHVSPEPNSGCWLWDGPCDHRGYGRIYLGGNRSRRTGAHRVSLAIAGVMVPPNMLVCHRCDVPCCVNPDHLFVGTQADNIADMIKKGRYVNGAYKLKGKPRPGIIFNAIKTHCKHGHPLSGDNIHVNARGSRCCRACWRMRKAKSQTMKGGLL